MPFSTSTVIPRPGPSFDENRREERIGPNQPLSDESWHAQSERYAVTWDEIEAPLLFFAKR